MVLYRAIDAYSDVFQGYFQQQNRSDLAGKVQFYRSWICIIVFGFSLLLTKSLMISSIVICLINLILTVVLDYRISIRNFNTKFFPSISKDCLLYTSQFAKVTQLEKSSEKGKDVQVQEWIIWTSYVTTYYPTKDGQSV